MWCHIKRKDMGTPLAKRGYNTPRTLESLRADHSRYMTIGGGNLKKAKLFNNCIEEPFFDIPLEQVCKTHGL